MSGGQRRPLTSDISPPCNTPPAAPRHLNRNESSPSPATLPLRSRHRERNHGRRPRRRRPRLQRRRQYRLHRHRRRRRQPHQRPHGRSAGLIVKRSVRSRRIRSILIPLNLLFATAMLSGLIIGTPPLALIAVNAHRHRRLRRRRADRTLAPAVPRTPTSCALPPAPRTSASDGPVRTELKLCPPNARPTHAVALRPPTSAFPRTSHLLPRTSYLVPRTSIRTSVLRLPTSDL
jgi:hypothetical protein